MFVRDYMTSPAITIRPELPVLDALKLMQDKHIRRLPVTNSTGWLKGIVSERDLLRASASPATTVTIWEVSHLIAKLSVEEVMCDSVHVVKPDDNLNIVARIMLDHKIGGLPVIGENNAVVGVITESDIFRAFLDRDDSREDTDALTVDNESPV